MAYANAADRHDHDKMRALYHEDAIDEHAISPRVRRWNSSTSSPRFKRRWRSCHHNVTTVNLKLAATRPRRVYLIAFHQVKEGERLHDVLIGGRYFDKYEKARRHLEIQPSLDRRRLGVRGRSVDGQARPSFLAGAYVGKAGAGRSVLRLLQAAQARRALIAPLDQLRAWASDIAGVTGEDVQPLLSASTRTHCRHGSHAACCAPSKHAGRGSSDRRIAGLFDAASRP